MAVRIRDLSAVRPPAPPPVPIPVAALSVGFDGVLQDVALVSQSVVASGGTAPYTFMAVGLPTGVVIDANTGAITGTPTVFGAFTATVTVTDSLGATVAVPVFFFILQTAFTDDFNRANSTAGFGDNWLYAGEPGATINSLVSGGWGISANVAQNQPTAVLAANQRPLTWYVVPVMAALRGQNQFSECRCTANNSLIGTRQQYMGPSVLGGWQAGPDYRLYVAAIIIDNVNANITIERWNSGGGVFTAIGAGFAGVVALGDLVRLEATINVADVTLELFVNGVSLGTRVDAGATRSVDGSPGVTRWLYASGAAPGVPVLQWDDYACGAI